MKLTPLLGLTLAPVKRRLRDWLITRLEEHYNISAAVEDARAREHLRNVAHFQKKAALTRLRRRGP